MWLMASDIDVRLEILDQAGQAVFGAMARLTHLDESEAVLSLEEPCSATRLHWGAPVRFELEDGTRRYEITGAIIARHEDESGGATVSAYAQERSNPTWEIRVRVWECKLNVQRRTLPRRKLRFRVHLRPDIRSEAVPADVDNVTEPIPAWCVDIGAGGLRIRTGKVQKIPQHLSIDFCVPINSSQGEVERSHRFCVAGRVVRATPAGRHGDDVEVAICFEGISVRDGMALQELLS